MKHFEIPAGLRGLREVRTATCPTHGEYESCRFSYPGRVTEPEWTGCPECRRKAELRAKEACVRAALEAEAARRMRLDSCIPPRFVEKRFETFRTDTDEQAAFLATAQAYVEHWPDYRADGRGLLVMGPAGTGKTHMLAAIANEIMGRYRRQVVYTSAPKLIMAVKESYRRDADRSEREVYASYTAPDLLCVDEFGRGFGTDGERTMLFEVINARYEAMKPTIIASNLTAGAMHEAYGDAVFSRLLECGQAVQLTGSNVRYIHGGQA